MSWIPSERFMWWWSLMMLDDNYEDRKVYFFSVSGRRPNTQRIPDRCWVDHDMDAAWSCSMWRKFQCQRCSRQAVVGSGCRPTRWVVLVRIHFRHLSLPCRQLSALTSLMVRTWSVAPTTSKPAFPFRPQHPPRRCSSHVASVSGMWRHAPCTSDVHWRLLTWCWRGDGDGDGDQDGWTGCVSGLGGSGRDGRCMLQVTHQVTRCWSVFLAYREVRYSEHLHGTFNHWKVMVEFCDLLFVDLILFCFPKDIHTVWIIFPNHRSPSKKGHFHI